MASKKLKMTKQDRDEVKRLAIRKEIDQLLHQKNTLSKKLDKLLKRYNQVKSDKVTVSISNERR